MGGASGPLYRGIKNFTLCGHDGIIFAYRYFALSSGAAGHRTGSHALFY